MEQTQVLLALIGAAGVGILAALVILRRQRRATMPQSSPFAVSTEGEKRCPHCGMGNMWTDARCVSCGRPLGG
jgi:LPXTG-motif cell wall-anchored protein